VNCALLVGALFAAGWSAGAVQIMVAIGAAESGCQQHVVHTGRGERSVGPLQINVLAHKWVTNACATSYYCSAKAAKRIWEKQGYRAWTVYLTGAYRQYLQLYTGEPRRTRR
jgi:hypothetical protein